MSKKKKIVFWFFCIIIPLILIILGLLDYIDFTECLVLPLAFMCTGGIILEKLDYDENQKNAKLKEKEPDIENNN